MSFARNLLTVSSLTIISRVSGFVRDTLTAAFLGAGPVADAVFTAQRLPNVFRSLFAEGAFSSAFVPLYTSEHKKNGHEAAQEFAGQAMAVLLAILIPFSVAVMAAVPLIARFLVSGGGEDQEKLDLTINLCMITFPYLTLISITALQGGVLNARSKFAAAAAAPISLNVVCSVALVIGHLLDWHMGYTLTWAFFFSGVVQMSWLAVSCYRAGVTVPMMWPKLNHATKRLLKGVGPGAIGSGAAQINLLLTPVLAAQLGDGAMSWLSYADRLDQLPLGIVGIAVGTTLLPLLSRHADVGSEDNFRHYTSRALEFCLMLGLPAMIGSIMLATPIVQTLFEHGAFGPEDTRHTAEALMAYSLGVPSFLIIKVFAAGLFARHDLALPVKFAMVAMLVNVVGAVLMLHSLQHIGIALASSIATTTNATLLFLYHKFTRQRIADDKFRHRLPRILICALAMAVVTALLARLTHGFFITHSLPYEIIGLAISIGGSMAFYGLMLQLTSAMRWQDALLILRRKSNDESLARSGPELGSEM